MNSIGHKLANELKKEVNWQAQSAKISTLTSLFSKLDLLVRVRYENPLPPPPFPPKLLNIPTHPSRYARFEFASKLADETPFPMIVDADMGMPIDLSKYPGLWDLGDEAEDYGTCLYI